MAKTAQTYDIDEMYTTVRRNILYGSYASGERLSETQLSKEFSCSRTPIREVLKRLEQDKLVVIMPKSGSYVKERNRQETREALEVRAYIEGLATRLVIERGVDCSSMGIILDKMDEVLSTVPVDIVAFGDLHYEFHHTLVTLSENALCISLFEKLNLRSSMQFFETMNKTSAVKTQNEHRKLLQYLYNLDKKHGEHFAIAHLWGRRNRENG